MAKKSNRPFEAKSLKKMFRRNGSTIGVAALAVSGLAAAAMSPKLREQTRQLKNRIVSRIEERRAARGEHRLANGAVSEHAH